MTDPTRPLPDGMAADKTHAWRRGGPSRGGPALRFWAAFVIVFATAGLFIWMTSWLAPVAPGRIVIVEADYATNLAVPLNVYAPAARDGLTKRVASATNWAEVAEFSDFHSARRGELRAELQTGGAKETKVVFVALHGIAEAGTAFLLPGDYRAGNRLGEALPLRDVLSDLKSSRAAHKVLILDATGLVAAPGLGVFRNDFADALKGLDAEIRAVPNLVVLSASGSGERSWPAPEFGRSAFAHFIIEGLAGAADANGDSRVTALELFEYASGQTSAYVARHFAAQQAPVLLPADEGPQRAAAVHVLDTKGPYRPTTAEYAKPTFADLGAEWMACYELANSVPPPQAYAPELWQEYLATLRRAEQLNLAGAPRVGVLTDRLSAIARDIKQMQALTLTLSTSVSCSVIALGRPIQDPPAPILRLVKDSDPADPLAATRFVESAFSYLTKTSILYERQDWGRAVRLAILKRAAADVRASTGSARAALGPTAEYARMLRELSGQPVQSCELNFLAVLARDLQADGGGPEWRERIAQALELRERAERAALAVRPSGHSYAEQIAPWVAAHVARGDCARQRFEDRLFGAPASDAAAADHAASLAAYDAALAEAETVRRALEEYHTSAADLHGYSRWAALSPPDARTAGVDVLAKVERYSEAVAALGRALRRSGPDRNRPIPSLDDMRNVVAGHRAELEAEYRRGLQRAIGLPAPAFWAAAESALANLAVPRDRALFEEYRKTRESLWRAWAERASNMRDDGPRAGTGPDPTAAARQARAAGTALRLAVEGYGDEAPAGPSALLTKLGDPPDVRAGAEFGRFCDALPGEIANRLRANFDAPAERAEDDEARTRRFAALADASRALDGSTNRRLFYQKTMGGEHLAAHPADANRRWLVRRALERQAGRLFEDHWYDAGREPRPYFRPAAKTCLNEYLPLAAENAGAERPSAFSRQLNRWLDEPDRLDVRFPTPGPVVGMPAEPVSVRPVVRYGPARDGAPAGCPGRLAYWLESGPIVSRRELAPLPTSGGGAGPPRTTGEPPPPLTLEPSSIGAEPAVTLRARFRGRILDQTSALAVARVPDVEVENTPPPPTARVTVRAGPAVRERFGQDPGTVAVVLDCSGSMGARAGEDPSKFEVAVDALKDVLTALPEGTWLSVWVFGADVPGVQPKTVEDTVRPIRRLAPWRRQDLAGVEAALRPLRPKYESPITCAVLRARKELADGPAGFSCVVLLTDGLDNRWQNDAINNPTRRPVSESIFKAFDKSNSRLDVIAFSVPKEEAEGVQAQFRVTEKLSPAGRFVNVVEVPKLSASLRAAVLAKQQIEWSLWPANDPTVRYRTTTGTSGGGDGWSPNVNPGTYELSTGAPPVCAGSLRLREGDNLVLRLAAGDGQLRVERELVTNRGSGLDRLGVRKARTSDENWQLLVAENSLRGGNLRLVPELERIRSPEAAQLESPPRPARVWFEVRGASLPPAARPVPIRWKPLFSIDHPVATWEITAPNWPRAETGVPARPRLRVWWAEGEEPEHLNATVGEPVKMGDTWVTVTASTPDGGGELFTVLVSTPPGQPCWVLPAEPGWALVGHQFYTDLGRVVATFRSTRPAPANSAAPGSAPSKFRLVPVSAFKGAAERAGRVLDLPGLDAPEAPEHPATRAKE